MCLAFRVKRESLCSIWLFYWVCAGNVGRGSPIHSDISIVTLQSKREEFVHNGRDVGSMVSRRELLLAVLQMWCEAKTGCGYRISLFIFVSGQETEGGWWVLSFSTCWIILRVFIYYVPYFVKFLVKLSNLIFLHWGFMILFTAASLV